MINDSIPSWRIHSRSISVLHGIVANLNLKPLSYFVPEDGDSELQPNVFLAPKPRQQGMPPTLGEVKSAFPLPGRYHFRFKAPLIPGGDREKNGMAVWMDCVDERQTIPVWQNGIIAKVTRIGVEDDDDDDDDADFGDRDRSVPSAPPRAAPAPAPAPRAPDPMIDIFNGPGPAVSQSDPGSNNLFDLPNPAPAAAAGVSLLDMNTPPSVYAHNQAPTSADHDFFGMTGTPQTPHQSQYGGNPYPTQTPAPHSGNNNAFNSFSQQQGPFGGLGTPWNP